MKITFDNDCKPEEVRFVWANRTINPCKENTIKEIEDRMKANMPSMDPEALAQTCLHAGV